MINVKFYDWSLEFISVKLNMKKHEKVKMRIAELT